MLPRINKLKKDNDFKNVFAKGRISRLGKLRIRYARNNEDKARFGLVVSKKVSKKAVDRNRIKRKVEEALRLNLSHIKPGYDIVILPDSEIKEEKTADLQKNLIDLLNKANLWTS